jgi:hypothetical protein
MWAMIRNVIATRGAQLVARYAAIGLVALGTKLSVACSAADVNTTAQTIGAFTIAAVLVVIDHYSHAKQGE